MKKFLFFLAVFFLSVGELSAKKTPPPPPEPLTPTEQVVSEQSENLVKKYWKFHHAAYIGYRRDRQHFNTYGPGLFDTRTNINDRNTVQVMVSSHAEYGDIVGYIRGSYGWLINGHTHFRVPGSDFSFPSFDIGAGYTTEARAALGYRIKLYDKPNFGFSFIPGAGYRYASMMNFSEGERRFQLPATANLAICERPNPNHQDWFGPYADARVEFRFAELCEWLLSCEYHQPYLVSKSKSEIRFYQYDTGGALVSDQLFRANSVLKAPSSHMLAGMSDVKFHYGTGWTYGFNFEAASTWSHKGTDRSTIKQEQFIATPVVQTETRATSRATVQWTFYALSLMLGHTF